MVTCSYKWNILLQDVNVINQSIWPNRQNFDEGFFRVRGVIVIWQVKAKKKKNNVVNEPHAGPWWELSKVGVHGPHLWKSQKGGMSVPVTLHLNIWKGSGFPAPSHPKCLLILNYVKGGGVWRYINKYCVTFAKSKVSCHEPLACWSTNGTGTCFCL